MNIYSIYVNPKEKENNFVVIKQGFSLLAAILNIFWALYHKMWRWAGIVLICNILAYSFDCEYVNIVLPIATMLVFGFYSVEMREYDLEKKQYLLEDIIVSSSQTEAELKFLERLGIVPIP